MLLIARAYGPELFGKVALAMSMMEIFRSFSEFGLDTISLRRFSQTANPDHHAELLSKLVPLKMAASFVFYVASLLVLAVLGGGPELRLGAVTGLSLFSANLIGILNSYYQSQLRMSNVFAVTVVPYGCYVALSAVAIHQQASLVLVLAILPIAETIYFLLLYNLDKPGEIVTFDVTGLMELFKESLPLGLMSALVLLYLRLDNIVVFKMLGSVALGLYATCVRFVEPALMVPGAFSATLLALLSSREKEHVAPDHLLRTSLHAMWPAYLFTAIAIVSIFVAGERVLLHFGAEYTAAYPALCMLATSLAVRAVNITLSTIINSRGGYYVLTRITAINLVVNICLIVLLVPKFGLIGAGLAVLGTELWNTVAQARSLHVLLQRSLEGLITVPAMEVK
jgi:O-antigen/teichoic acid export membrane protein